MAKILVIVPPTEQTLGKGLSELLQSQGHTPMIKEVFTPKEAAEAYDMVKQGDIGAIVVSNINVLKIGDSTLTPLNFISDLANIGKPVVVYDYFLNSHTELGKVRSNKDIKLVSSLTAEGGPDGLLLALNYLLKRQASQSMPGF